MSEANDTLGQCLGSISRTAFRFRPAERGLTRDRRGADRSLANGPGPYESHLANLYPFVKRQAGSWPVALSFLRPEFRSLKKWQSRAHIRVLEALMYKFAKVQVSAAIVRRADRGDYTLECIRPQTAPELRVPTFVLIPKKANSDQEEISQSCVIPYCPRR